MIRKPAAYPILLVAAALASSGELLRAVPFSLSNGSGDGSVTVNVDGYGAFGVAVGSDSSNAVFNPTGISPAASGTTFESGVAFRLGSSGARGFLTAGNIGIGAGSGGLANPTVTGTATSASSAFSPVVGLSFTLTQSLAPLLYGATQVGTIRTQTYNITNNSTATLDFELLRYFDGDLLLFDGSIGDGGGRAFAGSREYLLETDNATSGYTPTTFVGITAEGGTIPVVGRYEIDGFSGLRSRILDGTTLDNLIVGDTGGPDHFIDGPTGYDVTLALNNLFSLAAGHSTIYTTTTVFASGSPNEDLALSVPDGGSSIAFLGISFGTLVWFRRRMRS